MNPQEPFPALNYYHIDTTTDTDMKQPRHCDTLMMTINNNNNNSNNRNRNKAISLPREATNGSTYAATHSISDESKKQEHLSSQSSATTAITTMSNDNDNTSLTDDNGNDLGLAFLRAALETNTIDTISSSTSSENEYATIMENIQSAINIKELGNDCFNSKEYEQAIGYFIQSLQSLISLRSLLQNNTLNAGKRCNSGNNSMSIEQILTTDELIKENILSVHLNLSWTYNQMNLYNESLHHAESALLIDPLSPKALYRRALALSKLDSRLDQAIADLRVVADILPYNPAIHEELQHLRVRTVALQKNEILEIQQQQQNNITNIIQSQTDESDLCSYCIQYGTIRGCQNNCKLMNGKPICLNSSISPPHQYLFTKCEVKKHNTADDCWLIRQNIIMQAASYISQHPGGQRCIMKRCGMIDCSEDYYFHSSKAQKIWDSFKIGILIPCDSHISPRLQSSSSSSSSPSSSSSAKVEGCSFGCQSSEDNKNENSSCTIC